MFTLVRVHICDSKCLQSLQAAVYAGQAGFSRRTRMWMYCLEIYACSSVIYLWKIVLSSPSDCSKWVHILAFKGASRVLLNCLASSRMQEWLAMNSLGVFYLALHTQWHSSLVLDRWTENWCGPRCA